MNRHQASPAHDAPIPTPTLSKEAQETYRAFTDLKLNGEPVFSHEFLTQVYRGLATEPTHADNHLWAREMVRTFGRKQVPEMCRLMRIPVRDTQD